MFPPLREWTWWGVWCGLLIAVLALLPWFVFGLLVWAVLATP
jgi:hypothetical protein